MKKLEDMWNDELFTTVVVGIQILRDNERKQGYADGKADTPFTDTEEAEKKAYNKGLNDVWEVIKKITKTEDEGGYSVEVKRKLFNCVCVYDITHNYTPEEALAKIKDYEDKQKCKECKKTKDPIFYGHCVGECDYAKQTEDEIKVGDEVIVQVDRVGFVTGYDVFSDQVFVTTKYGWSDAFKRSFVKKTGRHFPQIVEVLEQIKGESDGK